MLLVGHVVLLHSFVVRSRSIYSSMFDCTTVSVGRPSGHHHKVGTKPGVAKFTPFSKNIEYRGGGDLVGFVNQENEAVLPHNQSVGFPACLTYWISYIGLETHLTMTPNCQTHILHQPITLQLGLRCIGQDNGSFQLMEIVSP